MARAILLLITLLTIFLHITTTAGATTKTTPATTPTTNFIKSSCSITQYPSLCIQSLSAYASSIKKSPRQLAQTALSVTLARAQSTKDFVTRSTKLRGLKSRESEAIKDCLDEMSDTVDRLSKSIEELKQSGQSKGQADFTWHMSNVETWVSAALTDENTCMDGFSEKNMNGRLKDSIRSRILNVAQVTSNALALVNQFASKH